MKCRTICSAALLISAAAATVSVDVRPATAASTYSWYGTGQSVAADWNDPANWVDQNTVNGVPNAVGDVVLIGNRSGTLADPTGGVTTQSVGSPSVLVLNGQKIVGSIYAGQANDKNICFMPGSGGGLTFDTGTASDAILKIRRDFSATASAANLAQLRGGINTDVTLNSNLVFDLFTKRGYGTSTIASDGSAGVPGSQTMTNYINGTISGPGSLTMQVALLTSTGQATSNAFYSIEGGTGPNTFAGGTTFNKLIPTTSDGSVQYTTDVQSVYRLNKQSATGTGNTVVNPGADVIIANIADPGGAINDSTTVSLATDGTSFGRLAIADGYTETVAGLILNGVPQAPGTYGPTGSGAQHIDDSYFTTSEPFVTGTFDGVLNVVPEPTTAGLLAGMAALGAMKRRRRVPANA